MKQDLELSVSSCGSAAQRWKDHPKRPLIQKIIKLENGDFALILTQDPSKPLRYLYMTMLMPTKQGIINIQKITRKLQSILTKKQNFEFQDLTVEMKKIGTSIKSILKQLNVLRKKLNKLSNDNIGILKLIHQYDIADSILVLALRGIANSIQLDIKNALDCNSSLGLNQIQKLMISLGNQKLPHSAKNNRFVIFCDLSQIQCQFLKEEGIAMQNQATNYQQLSDSHIYNYEEHVMIEKLYSLL